VRRGNPKVIKSLEDLTKPNIYLLDVNGEGSAGLWEELAGKKGLIPEIQKRIAITVETTEEAIENWKTARRRWMHGLASNHGTTASKR
jgi:accessory colonization factor AcfC